MKAPRNYRSLAPLSLTWKAMRSFSTGSPVSCPAGHGYGARGSLEAPRSCRIRSQYAKSQRRVINSEGLGSRQTAFITACGGIGSHSGKAIVLTSCSRGEPFVTDRAVSASKGDPLVPRWLIRRSAPPVDEARSGLEQRPRLSDSQVRPRSPAFSRPRRQRAGTRRRA